MEAFKTRIKANRVKNTSTIHEYENLTGPIRLRMDLNMLKAINGFGKIHSYNFSGKSIKEKKIFCN